MPFMGIVVFVVPTKEGEHYRGDYITAEKQSTAKRKVQFAVSAPCADSKKVHHPKATPEEVKQGVRSEPMPGKVL